MNTISHTHKNEITYLDVATNGNGLEKAVLTSNAIQRLNQLEYNILEVGPGGGSSINALGEYLGNLSGQAPKINLNLLELENVKSQSLDDAMERISSFGESLLLSGNVVELDNIAKPESMDIVSTSAVLHEVYSYNGGYGALDRTLRGIATTLKTGGYFAYRDVYSVETDNLHESANHAYNADSSKSWLRFIKLFMPYYLNNGQHPYHHLEDHVKIKQGSLHIDSSDIDVNKDTLIRGPIGIMREIQRHYITLRDDVWRTGTLGFIPELEGDKSNDWLNIKQGHKRVHFKFTDSDFLSFNQRTLLTEMSERVSDHFVIDGDIFDAISDTALNNFLETVQKGQDDSASEIWEDWQSREGRETYAYMTVDQLIGNIAIRSVEASKNNDGAETILLPEYITDVKKISRTYYNRFLKKALSNPLFDGKQLILAKKIPLKDVDSIATSLDVVQKYCSRETTASLYSLISSDV